MVTIQPFCALRYSSHAISDASQVLAPPYDVIDADTQERLYQRSPYNVVRLILGKQFGSDTEQDNRYTRAQRDFDAWRERRVLDRDALPALYLVEHTFDDRGISRRRLGFIALLALTDATTRAVLRHEATLAAPKHDRTKLLDAIPANLEPIFCIYPDEGATVQRLLEQTRQQAAPTLSATIGVEAVRLWMVTQPELIEPVRQRLSAVSVLIADGHHRFEVAHANRHRYGAVMTYFVSMEDPALALRPIHRIVQPATTPTAAQTLQQLCVLEPSSDVPSLLHWLQAVSGQGSFGYWDGRGLYRVTVKPESLARWLLTPSVPQPIASLDVSILHGLLFASCGIEGSPLRYTVDAADAVQTARALAGSSAWLLRPIPLRQVFALAAQGLMLPPKSTYFYPKVPSGLTMHVFA